MRRFSYTPDANFSGGSFPYTLGGKFSDERLLRLLGLVLVRISLTLLMLVVVRSIPYIHDASFSETFPIHSGCYFLSGFPIHT